MLNQWSSAVPVLRVMDSARAAKFYVDRLGFDLLFTYRPDPDRSDPAYLSLAKDGVRLHVSSFPGDGVAGSVVNVYVDDVDSVFAEVTKLAEARIDLPPTLQTWGNREMYLRDPDGNCLRFIQLSASGSTG